MRAGRLNSLIDDLDRRIRDPLQLRLILCASILAAWFFFIYSPLTEGIAQAEQQRSRSETHLTLAKEIESLRVQVGKFQNRLPTKTDPNEWVEYLLVGIRKFPVRLVKLEPQVMRKHGPYNVVVLKIELMGSYKDLDDLMAWIEINPRLLRIDTVDFQPNKGLSGGLILSMTVLGVMG